MSAGATTSSGSRIPTLDGWRGIAILLVLADHLQIMLFGGPYRGHEYLMCGQHGVTLFFVLSGFLITSRLLEEKKINLKAFYIRRVFRLMPCAWSYLLMLFIVGLVTGSAVIGKDAWSCVFFFRNYSPAYENAANMRTGHFWSLSLEEQFYLGWPPLLALIGRKRALGLAGAGILICATFRFFTWQHYAHPIINQHSEVRVDALLLGCAFAILLGHTRFREWVTRYSGPLFLVSLPLALWYGFRYQILIPAVESLLLAVMILCTSLNPSFLPFRILEWKRLKFVGLISYSLYVWQQGLLFINHSEPYGALFLPLVAILSYGLIEQPCIRFGRRLIAARAATPDPEPSLLGAQ